MIGFTERLAARARCVGKRLAEPPARRPSLAVAGPLTALAVRCRGISADEDAPDDVALPNGLRHPVTTTMTKQ
jgi:hypothetical protein